MAHKLLDLYKKELSLKRIMLRYLSAKYYILSSILLLVVILIVVGINIYVGGVYGLLSFFIIIGWIIFLNKYTNYERDRIKNEIHKGKNYNEIKQEKLKKFLRTEALDVNPQKIKLLIELTEKSAEEFKSDFFIGRGAFLSITIPIIVATVSYIYNKHVERLEVALVVALLLLVAVIFIFFYVSLFKILVYDEFINGDYKKLKTIANDLRELYFREV